MDAPQQPPHTAPRPLTVIGVLAVAALLIAPAAPAAGLNRLLPDEDRRLLAATPATPDELAALAFDEGEIRLFDLIPPEDAASEGEKAADEADTEEPQEVEHVYHVVAAGESLADIAALHGLDGADDWRRLYDANPGVDDPDLVEVGTRLRIPGPDEELAQRDLPAPPPPRPGVSTARAAGAGVWDQLARCESGGNWAANTGNGYYGGLQFSASSWAAVGGTGLPHQHSRATQIAMGERLRAAQGWGAWPSCSRRIGLR
jgi:hypothetical protein